MGLISAEFIFFIIIVVLVYFIIPKKYQWIWLLAASYIFYLFYSFASVIFILFTTISTFLCAKRLGKINENISAKLLQGLLTKTEKLQIEKKATIRKRWLIAVILCINFSFIAVLKNSDLIHINMNGLFEFWGVETPILINFIIPLGISFYTLQCAGYIFDVYREKYKPDKNIAKFALFVSYFPQIIQGPIGRHDALANQLYMGHRFDFNRFKSGLQLIVWGYFKKLVIADRAAVAVNQIFNNYQYYSGIQLFFGAALYGLQVYADFSGGIDIITGISEIMGINLAKNFERPYFSRSIAEFWRRWHITLGTWMKDYVFYPLSLSKPFGILGKKSRKIFGSYFGKMLPAFLSMFIVFFFVGVWHGSSLKFAVYGIWNGAIIVSSLMFKPVYQKIQNKMHIKPERFDWVFFQILRTFVLVSIGRYFSRADTLTIASDMLKKTFTTWNPWSLFDSSLLNLGLDMYDYIILVIGILILFFVGLAQEKGNHIRKEISKQGIVLRWTVYLGAIFFILIFGVYGLGYDASQYIYANF